ncbi:MAG: T9SS type A sorting domain-containing protein [Bacteroidota bacterium]
MYNSKIFILIATLALGVINLPAQQLRDHLNGRAVGEEQMRAPGGNQPSLVGPSNSCPLTTATYTIQGLNTFFSYSFNWQVNGGYIVGAPNPPQASSSVTVFWNSNSSNNSISVDAILPWGSTHYSFSKDVNLTAEIPYHVTTSEMCAGQMISGNAYVPGATNYQWTFSSLNGSPSNGLNLIGNTGHSIVIEGLAVGNYNIHVDAQFCGNTISYGNQLSVNTNDCEDDGLMLLEGEMDSSAPVSPSGTVLVYPNPIKVGQEIGISGPEDWVDGELQLLTTTGQEVGKWNWEERHMTIPSAGLVPGIYLLQAEQGGQTVTKKLVITE